MNIVQRMNNQSIGADIEKISRFKNLDREKDKKFLNKIFTKEELDYCFSNIEPAHHLAARFVAKEAVIKAIASLGDEVPTFEKINVRRDRLGIPSVELTGYIIKISLSHCQEFAIAFVLLNRVDS